uniref:Uncharacterized protein n=1 Tax=Sarcophilus harrisii TaxID=9305 RepID=A0A7N4NGK7_SARHA
SSPIALLPPLSWLTFLSKAKHPYYILVHLAFYIWDKENDQHNWLKVTNMEHYLVLWAFLLQQHENILVCKRRKGLKEII